jgi:hypothetical protein
VKKGQIRYWLWGVPMFVASYIEWALAEFYLWGEERRWLIEREWEE